MRSLLAPGLLAVSAALYAHGFPIVETYTAYRTFQNGVLVAENSSASSSTAVSTAAAGSTGAFESFGGVGGVAH